MAIRSAPLLNALEEDRRSAWVPDPLGWIDAEGLVDEVLENRKPIPFGPFESIPVPKPDGSFLVAPVLALPTLAQFHAAVAPLKAPVDSALSPGVCGYRRGAESGLSYSPEHRRFHEFALSEAENSAFVVLTDVQRFFQSSSWNTAIAQSAKLAGTDATRRLALFAHSAKDAGLDHLPAGYADARFLSNAVLADSDDAIRAPFARWVDDYRIFAQSDALARQALDRLGATLDLVGLQLNKRKTRIIRSPEFPALRGASLESVYHPDHETREEVRASLRTVFAEAAADPVANRRKIRFVLPRLAEQGDDIAVEWALSVLPTIPWEAPRICAYLGRFGDDRTISNAVEQQLLSALSAKSFWLAVRLAALACQTGLSRAGADAVALAIRTTHSPALWSLLLRSLSLSGRRAHVLDAVEWGVVDERGALGALRDIDSRDVAKRTSGSASTRESLQLQPAPAPQLDSIL